MKLLKHIANLGYGSRKDIEKLLRAGRVTDWHGHVLGAGDSVEHAAIRLDGQPLDPPPGSVIMLHKPVGYTTSARDVGALVYDLLPARFALRKPLMAPVGRLDRDTSGLLLFTDDGTLLHRLTSPRHHVPKIYQAGLARPLRGDETAVFAEGALMLEGEKTPLLPAEMVATGERAAQLTLHEGRYHQVRRMFAALGNHVETLHRSHFGALALDGVEPGQWRLLTQEERQALGAP